MKLSDWFSQESGRQAAMAQHFRVTESAVSQWADKVPVRRMKAIRDYTLGAVSIEEMIPDDMPASEEQGA